MRALEFDDELLRQSLAFIRDEDVRRAADALVSFALNHPALRAGPAFHGAIRTFRYSLERGVDFAFIFNRSSLLFYVRRPALKRPGAAGLVKSALSQSTLSSELTNASEYAIRVRRLSDAAVINDLIAAIAANRETRRPKSSEDPSMPKKREPIRRPAARVRQGQLLLYATSLEVRHVLKPGFYDIERLDPANVHDKGYQRILNVARAKRLADYLVTGQESQDAFLPTSVFLATHADLIFDSASNMLEIDLDEVGSFSVVDGQHRLEGLRLAADRDPAIQSFEIPVNIAVGLPKIAQMCHFLIVNTTQKAVDKAVEQRLIARLTEMIESEEVPTLPKWIRRVVETGDDASALHLIDYLNTAPESPWLGKIKMPNQEAAGATVSQKSFVIAIKKYVLAASNPLIGRPLEQQKKIFLNYWRAISDEIGTDEETVLFKSIGVELFCRFSGPLFSKLQAGNDFKVSAMRKLLRQAFDNMETEFAGIGSADWWLSGSGPAGGLNSAALAKVNQELARALHRGDNSAEVDL